MSEALVQFIAAEPGMAARLLRAHTSDGKGRCRACSAGPQAGRVVWPCTTHAAAVQAAAEGAR